jgi:NADH dehydrogenase
MTARGGPTLVITGADGYIGSAVVRTALAQGAQVHALSRRPSADAESSLRRFRYDLAEPVADEPFVGATAVIHLAVDNAPSANASGDDVNTAGTVRLLDAARRNGVPRFIFVSSQSAASRASSLYARSKADSEALMIGEGDVIVRPGMVYGGKQAGLYGLLCSFIKRTSLLPLPRAHAPVQPIHVDDLAAGLVQIGLVDDDRLRLYQLAAEQPMTFAAYLIGIARYRFERRLFVVPLPLGPILAMTQLIAILLPSFRALRERLAGLRAATPMDCHGSLAALGMTLQNFEASLRREAASAATREGESRRPE